MKIQKVYNVNDVVVLDDARFETFNDVSVVVGKEACLLNSELVKVIEP